METEDYSADPETHGEYQERERIARLNLWYGNIYELY